MDANSPRALEIARSLLSQPTVALIEDRPARWISDFAKERDLDLTRDQAGNLVVSLRGTDAKSSEVAPIVLVAHLDHPGFVYEGDSHLGTGSRVDLAFRGGLMAENALSGSSIAFFHPESSDPVGTGTLIEPYADQQGRLIGATAEITSGAVAPGHFAMWDFAQLGPYGVAVGDDQITARACDDLLGAAAILSALESLAERAPAGASIHGLFTRAEEIGFYGAIEAVRLGTVVRTSLVLSIECSKALGHAPQGDGVIVRVGDRLTVFDPRITEALRASCETEGDLARERITYQRKLMDGGACEASVFCASGYRASGLALPLGNYHNATDNGPGIAAEHVRTSDYLSGVELLTRLSGDPGFVDKVRDTTEAEWLAQRRDDARLALDPSIHAKDHA